MACIIMHNVWYNCDKFTNSKETPCYRRKLCGSKVESLWLNGQKSVVKLIKPVDVLQNMTSLTEGSCLFLSSPEAYWLSFEDFTPKEVLPEILEGLKRPQA
ncbi:hypothetical protein L195_g002809 [Trifolium pratense]|uniref:Uncharacterized protein n=1 Tax=Trifolium pratense TaxID=57577 RepID=A0A2K3NTI6_TRIPR|nr:hypothetical protein L195_g002809 [Trifolium pratense]